MCCEDNADAMEVPFLGSWNELGTLPSPTEVAAVPQDCVVVVEDVPEQSQPVQGSSEILYSVLASRSYYYEVVKQTKVKPRSNALRFVEEAHMYAVELQPNFIHYLAERTAIPHDASLHVCVHNPMIDPYLTELYQNFQKGVDRENLLMIILPPLVHFSACLASPVLARTRTAKCTQYVTTLGDFETLLLQMTAGFMPKLIFVLPIGGDTYSQHRLAPFEVWLSSERVLGSRNCHWGLHCDVEK